MFLRENKYPPLSEDRIKGIAIVLLIIFSNLYLQWCQNNLSVELALKFAFSWHTAKVFLGLWGATAGVWGVCQLGRFGTDRRRLL